MITGGVDMAADPKRTALCSIDWVTGEIRLSNGPVDDDAIVALTHQAVMSGWDVPLGWPDAFVAAISEHHVGQPLAGPGASPTAQPDLGPPDGGHPVPERFPAGPDARRYLRYRLTDRRFAESGRWPLSVSTDLIGVPAMRAAALQQRLDGEGLLVDRSGTAGVIAETYPAGTLAAWGWPSRGYKGAAGREVRADLVARLIDSLPRLGLTGAVREALVVSDARLDAFICALVARAVDTGRGTPPPPADLAVARREGWIHIASVIPTELITI